MYKYSCVKLLVPLLLLGFAALLSPPKAEAQCLLPGMAQVSTADSQLTVSVYDMHGNTAAHKDLPFGTKLRVCYEGCVDVRINDRGPYIGARELDLSYGAASAIGLIHPGVADVTVEYI